MSAPTPVPDDDDIQEVAVLLGARFEGMVSRSMVTRTVWMACRDLDREVPRAALAEFTHRLAGQRISAAIESRERRADR